MKNDPTIPRCLSFNEPMKLQHKHSRPSKTNSYNYSVRRFICELCDTVEVIHAEGERDIVVDPREAVKASKKAESNEVV